VTEELRKAGGLRAVFIGGVLSSLPLVGLSQLWLYLVSGGAEEPTLKCAKPLLYAACLVAGSVVPVLLFFRLRTLTYRRVLGGVAVACALLELSLRVSGYLWYPGLRGHGELPWWFAFIAIPLCWLMLFVPLAGLAMVWIAALGRRAGFGKKIRSAY
jgi:hypothetical protein